MKRYVPTTVQVRHFPARYGKSERILVKADAFAETLYPDDPDTYRAFMSFKQLLAGRESMTAPGFVGRNGIEVGER